MRLGREIKKDCIISGDALSVIPMATTAVLHPGHRSRRDRLTGYRCTVITSPPAYTEHDIVSPGLPPTQPMPPPSYEETIANNVDPAILPGEVCLFYKFI